MHDTNLTLRKLSWAKLTIFWYYGLLEEENTFSNMKENWPAYIRTTSTSPITTQPQLTLPLSNYSRSKVDSLLFLTMFIQELLIKISVCQKTLRKESSCPWGYQNAEGKLLNFRSRKNLSVWSSTPTSCSTEEAGPEPHVPPDTSE